MHGFRTSGEGQGSEGGIKGEQAWDTNIIHATRKKQNLKVMHLGLLCFVSGTWFIITVWSAKYGGFSSF
jgi:hypothetical protein